MKKIKNKAQMEIMGLAIIIILITLAVLFVVQFVVLRPQSDIRKTFTHKELATNTVNAMLSTSTECRELPISQLLRDCSDGGFISCSASEDSCDFAESTINIILENTLQKWNKKYYLTVKTGNRNILDPFEEECPGEKITSSPCCILPTSSGPMIINLDICG